MKEKEEERLKVLKEQENLLRIRGFNTICGIDEAGRGPLAGPVVVASVIMPADSMIEGINDSKKISEKKREALYDQIIEEAISYGVGIIGQDEIDEINILNATKKGLIIAKVTRDRIMREWDKIYPQYGFEQHKGYGTTKHIAAIKEYGLCPIHRKSFTKNFI